MLAIGRSEAVAVEAVEAVEEPSLAIVLLNDNDN